MPVQSCDHNFETVELKSSCFFFCLNLGVDALEQFVEVDRL